MGKNIHVFFQNINNWEWTLQFPGGPVSKAPHFHCSLIPGWGTKIPHAAHSQKNIVEILIVWLIAFTWFFKNRLYFLEQF